MGDIGQGSSSWPSGCPFLSYTAAAPLPTHGPSTQPVFKAMQKAPAQFTCPSYRKKLHSPPSPQASPCIAGCFAWNGKNNLNNVPLPKLSVVNEEGTLMLVLVLISAETTDT